MRFFLSLMHSTRAATAAVVIAKALLSADLGLKALESGGALS